jgi:hypothetical protein
MFAVSRPDLSRHRCGSKCFEITRTPGTASKIQTQLSQLTLQMVQSASSECRYCCKYFLLDGK